MTVALVAGTAQVVCMKERSQISAMLSDIYLRAHDVVDVAAGCISPAENTDQAEGISRENERHSPLAPLCAVVKPPQTVGAASMFARTRVAYLPIVGCVFTAVVAMRCCSLAVTT